MLKPASKPAAKPAQPAATSGPAASLLFPGRNALRTSEVAERLQVSQRHVHDLIDEGKLQAFDLGGRHNGGRRRLRIPVEAYEAFLKERMV